jgi:hypothetical protein
MFIVKASFPHDTNHYSGRRANHLIGLFSTEDKAIDAAHKWIKEEREDGTQGEIFFLGETLHLDETRTINMASFPSYVWEEEDEFNKKLGKLMKEFPGIEVIETDDC